MRHNSAWAGLPKRHMTPISRDSIVYQKLFPIAKALNEADCDYCNDGDSDKHALLTTELMRVAEQLCSSINLKAFHQSDPRGCSLYIIDSTMNDTNYSNGQAVYAD